MKPVYGVLGLIASILIIISLEINYINNATSNLLTVVDDIELSAVDDNYTDAQKKFYKLNSAWDENEGYLSIFIHKEKMDNIEENISTLGIYITEEETVGVREMTESLRMNFRQIRQSENFSIATVL